MKINRPLLKRYSRKYISETQPSPVVVALVLVLILYVIQLLYTQLIGYDALMNDLMEQYNNGNYDYIPVLPQLAWYAIVVVVALNVMSAMLNAGFTIYCLNVVKKNHPGFGDLFDGFAIFLKLIWLLILVFVFTFLWSLLLIIPGIIAAYRYRQALYIMVENPEMSALQCITASKKMMYGHKTELFVMDLSFLGWYILCSVPFVCIWVYPYTRISYATFYVALRDMPSGPAASV